MNADELAKLVAKFPVPAAKDGKLAEVDKAATDEAVTRLVMGGREAVAGLVRMLIADETGGDSQVRHALHTVVTFVARPGREGSRRAVATELAAALAADLPPTVQAFVLRQLQLVGGKEATPAVGKLLTDEALGPAAAQTLLAIKDGAVAQFRAALAKAEGRARLAVIQGLGVMRDAGSAAALRAFATDADADTRVTAVWALAMTGDAGSADAVLKAADSAGYERIKATQACLLLAENLLAAGRKAEAARIYARLNETRTDPSERHVRDAAARGLAAAK